MRKKDGTKPTLRAVDGVLAKKKRQPQWQGDDSSAGGRPRSLTLSQAQQLLQLVFKERGKARVTVSYCRWRLPFLREVAGETVRRALLHAGSAYLRRRGKTAVPQEWRAKRMVYCRWILRQSAADLRKYAYADGTTFYLARSPAEQSGQQRAAPGPSLWRMANGKDGLWDENIGPSLYAKSRAKPVKIWGYFSDGMLQYYVLPRDGQRTVHMNPGRFVKLVRSKFAKWRRLCLPRCASVTLVHDHERCLVRPESVRALKAAGCVPIKKHPRHSADRNVIEVWWNRLRLRLEKIAPATAESRPQFLQRLRRTVTWLNARQRHSGRKLCRGQRRRATSVLQLRGAKCKY